MLSDSVSGTNIILAGFMGTGKSCVGRCLARNIGFAFLDTDALIETEVGATISDIFRTRGEPWFRRAEARAIRLAATRLTNTVISLGGGALMDRRNVDVAKRAGVVVWLRSSPEAVLARLSTEGANGIGARPVLGGEANVESLRHLMSVREPGYRQAHLTVDTDGKSPDEVACEMAQAVLEHLSSVRGANPGALSHCDQFALGPSAECNAEQTGRGRALKIEISAGNATYPCFVGQEMLGCLSECLPGLEGLDFGGGGKSCKVIVVTNCMLRSLLGAALERGLRARSGDAAEIVWAVVPDGERAKSLSTMGKLYDLACAAGAKRDCLVIAMGGGTVGDAAGFFAATYMRGVRLVHVPTTLLAMVDSAVGGKAAINLKAAKNLVGAFWQPAAVVSDVVTLRTLTPPEFTNGLAEVVKAAVIGDPVLFDMLDDIADVATCPRAATPNGTPRKTASGNSFAVARTLQRDPELLQAVICRAVAVKAKVVSRDERDTGDRLLLNLGHTLGHAVEQAGGFRRWTHGEAVAIGLAAACRASARLGHLAPDSSERVMDLLSKMGLPTSLSREHAAKLGEKIVAAMALDKKAGQSGLRVVLPSSIGQCLVLNGIPGEALLQEMTATS